MNAYDRDVNPLIQYTEAADGVHIAYYSMGRGVPFVVTAMLPWGHLGNTHVFKEHYRSASPGGLGRGMQVVRYDARGTGLSDRGAVDFSMDAQMRDLEAVRSALGLERFVLFGRQAGCLLAVTYAAKNPDRVSHLVLAEPVVRAGGRSAGATIAGIQPVAGMTHDQWVAYTLAIANITLGYSSQTSALALASEYRASLSPEAYLTYFDWRGRFDASDQLQKIDAPTLVLSRRRAHLHATAAGVAAAIKSARIFSIDADGVVPGRWLPEETAAIEEFLGIAPRTHDADDEAPTLSDTAPLTPREREVLTLLVAGRSNREIAADLVLSERTVARHVANMYEKTGVHGRVEITKYALRHHLV